MSMSNYFVCSVQRFATVCYVQIHVLCDLKSLRDDQRAPEVKIAANRTS